MAERIDISARQALPIWRYREEIMSAVRQHQVLIIAGETGSGKTTQLPQFCLDAGRGYRCLGVSQPRRIAATALARRLAVELGCEVGGEVGYKIRFQQQLSAKTRIKVLTDGILLTELQQDHLLRRYDTLIIDEAHERSLNIDFTLGLIKQILPQRLDLRLIVTSATIDTEKFAAYFNGAPVLQVEGRSYPVELRYQPPAENEAGLGQQVAEVLDQLIDESPSGDVLIFLPTEASIHETCRVISGRHAGFEVLPLFTRLPSDRQQLVFTPSRKRRVIASTNIAETSLTIPGIRYVIDTGLARIGHYHSSNSTFSLLVSPIPQSSADQRAGRCGRVQNGVCVRLYSQQDYLRRPRYLKPEIQRSNLAAVILQMLQLQLQPGQFELIDSPSRAAFQEGLRTLKELHAVVNEQGKYQLTTVGRQLVRLPLDPRLAAVLLQADREGALEEALILVTVMGMQEVRERPLDAAVVADASHKRFRDPDFARRIFPAELLQKIPSLQPPGEVPLGGRRNFNPHQAQGEKPLSDLLSYLLLWHYSQQLQKKVSKNQWRKICRSEFLSPNRLQEWAESLQQVSQLLVEVGLTLRSYQGKDLEGALYRSVARGFLSHLGQRQPLPAPANSKGREQSASAKAARQNHYLMARSRSAKIHPGSSLFSQPPAWIVAVELVHTSALYARCVFPVEPKMIIALADELCERKLVEPQWSRASGRVLAKEKVLLFGLLLDQGKMRPYGVGQPAEAQQILIRQALLPADFEASDLALLPFITENRQRVAAAETSGNKLRRAGLALGEEGLFQFYRQLLEHSAVVDRNTLLQFARQQPPECLQISDEYLYAQLPPDNLAQLFPDSLQLGKESYQLEYHFQPGAEQDGVSIKVPLGQRPPLQSINLPLLVPGYLREGLDFLLQNLPRNYRRQLAPKQEKIEGILPGLQQRLARLPQIDDRQFASMLSRELSECFDIVIAPSLWPLGDLPEHLKLRLLLLDPQQRELESARNLKLLKRNHIVAPQAQERQQAEQQWQQGALSQWPDCGPLPERLHFESGILYPTLLPEPLDKVYSKAAPAARVYQRGQEQQLQPAHCGHDPLLQLPMADQLALSLQLPELKAVSLRLLPDAALAHYCHPLGCAWLVAWQHRRVLKDLRQNFYFDKTTFPPGLWGGALPAARLCFSFAVEQVLRCNAHDSSELLQYSQEIRARFPAELLAWLQLWQEIVAEAWRLRLQLEQTKSNCPHPSFLAQIEERWQQLLDPFLFALHSRESSPYLQRLPVYLQGLKLRLERGLLNPPKDAVKAQQVQPLCQRFQQEYARARPSLTRILALHSCLWQLEELQLQCFAPELKLKEAPSMKRLQLHFENILAGE